MLLPEPLQNLVDAFSRLPGIGPKTAARLTFYLLHASESYTSDLAQALEDLHSKTAFCQICYNITLAGKDKCDICTDEKRNPRLICIVEDPLDVIALERTGSFNGVYHVLQGVLSPIAGIGPDDIKIKEFFQRVQSQDIEEVIIATNPSMEGDATAMYIRQQLNPAQIKITRLARGLPVGGDLEYADQNTILRALMGRQDMS